MRLYREVIAQAIGSLVAPALVLEADAHVELLREVVPGELASGTDTADQDEPRAARLPHESRARAPHHRPPGVFPEAAAVGLDPRVAGPPVREVVRLGDEGPGLLPGDRKDLRRLLPHSPRRS